MRHRDLLNYTRTTEKTQHGLLTITTSKATKTVTPQRTTNETTE
jgi:hypothetical protein